MKLQRKDWIPIYFVRSFKMKFHTRRNSFRSYLVTWEIRIQLGYNTPKSVTKNISQCKQLCLFRRFWFSRVQLTIFISFYLQHFRVKYAIQKSNYSLKAVILKHQKCFFLGSGDGRPEFTRPDVQSVSLRGHSQWELSQIRPSRDSWGQRPRVRSHPVLHRCRKWRGTLPGQALMTSHNFSLNLFGLEWFFIH